MRHHIGGCFAALHGRVMASLRGAQGSADVADPPVQQVRPRVFRTCLHVRRQCGCVWQVLPAAGACAARTCWLPETCRCRVPPSCR